MGRAIGALAPIAAGFAFPGFGTAMGLGAGIGAGALTGAGIAALSGEDMLTGAVSGGLGGYGGGGFAKAADSVAAKALANNTTNAALNQGTSMFNRVTDLGTGAGVSAPISQANVATKAGIDTLAPTVQGGAGPNMAFAAPPDPTFTETISESLSDTVGGLKADAGQIGNRFDTITNNFSDTMTALGDGSKTAGYAKAGLTALPVGVAALTPEIQPFEKNPNELYDPTRRLDLSMDTGIDEALARDSGLRLLAKGGDVGGGVTGEGLAPGTPVAGAMGSGMHDGHSHAMGTFSDMVAMGVHPANAAAEVGMDPTPYLKLGPGRMFERPTSRSRELMATGGYLNGGTLKGDGMSDDVPAMIDGTQKAALSQGEFVVPADVVSHLGNGSSDAGSKRLYGMMDKVRKARTGNEKQGKQINPERFMPS
jgi:hypothetical protein